MMKRKKLGGSARRAASLLLAAAMLVPFGAFAPKARAAVVTPNSGSINLVEWDWIDDIQTIGTDANCADANAKYSRIMLYQNADDGDRYFLNADANDGNAGNKGGISKYNEETIPHVSDFRVGLDKFKEWNDDLVSGDHFVTVGGVRTPYLQYAGVSHDYHTWRLWSADKNTDARQEATFMLVNDYEDLDLRSTYGGLGDPHSVYGADNTRIRSDGWIIARKFVAVVGDNVVWNQTNHAIWHWDNDSNAYNEALDFDINTSKKELLAKAYNTGTDTGVENFKIYLGREHKTGALTSDFSVNDDQITTLGNPAYYICKGSTLRVKSGGILSVTGTLLNDGKIVVEDGGLLILNDGARIMPLTKYDTACGAITSSGGSIVVGENAMLCGGGTNGLVLNGGGVINYGVIAAEAMTISMPYTVENRENGWIIAGHSPSRATRVQLLRDSFNKTVTDLSKNPDSLFAKVENVNSIHNIVDNAVVGKPSQMKLYGEKALSSSESTVLTVYVKDKYHSTETKLFQERASDVSLRMDGNKAIFTAGGRDYTVEDQMISATVSAGKGAEKLFTDYVVGGPENMSWDKALAVELEPACAPGTRLDCGNNGASGANVYIYNAHGAGQQKWIIRRESSGTVNGTPRYIYSIRTAMNKEETVWLDVTGNGNLPSGTNVGLYTRDGDNDQYWAIEYVGDGCFCLRNYGNQGACLDVNGGGGSESNVQIYTANGSNAQKWRIANQLTEQVFASALNAAGVS